MTAPAVGGAARPRVEIVAIAEIGFETWKPLWNAYLDFYKTSVPEDRYDLTWRRLIGEARRPGERTPAGFAANHEGRTLGIAHYLYHDHCWKQAQTCYFQDLYVVPDARGLGVGRALIRAVVRQAEADGMDGCYWMTQSFNTPGRVLYDKVATLTPFVRYMADPSRV